MKRILAISCLLLTGFTFAQVQVAENKPKRSYSCEKVIRGESKPVKVKETISDIFGDFYVDKYNILSTTTPSARELNELLGSLIKIQESHVTGDEIDPITFEMYEIEHMSSNDYIYRVFGRQIRAQEPDLPAQVKVHKTTNTDCYGIIDLGNGKAAIPYRGVLLFVSQR